MALTLRDGAVTLNTNLGSGKLDVQIRPPRVRFDDNQWHRVNIHRKAQEVLHERFSQTHLIAIANPITDLENDLLTLFPSSIISCLFVDFGSGKSLSRKPLYRIDILLTLIIEF